MGECLLLLNAAALVVVVTKDIKAILQPSVELDAVFVPARELAAVYAKSTDLDAVVMPAQNLSAKVQTTELYATVVSRKALAAALE